MCAEHYALLAACQAGDLTHAKTLLVVHLQVAADALIQYLQHSSVKSGKTQ